MKNERKKKYMRSLIAGVALTLGVCNAQAATVSLVPLSGPVAQGGLETFSLIADFGSQSILGGGIDFSWNSSVLTFDSFSLDAGVAPPVTDNSFNEVDLQSAGLLSIVIGNFAGFTLPANTVVGILTFNAIGTPGSIAPITLADSSKWGGFLDVNGIDPIAVTYTGTTASIATAAVPVPPAAWLFGSGLLGLIGVARRKQVLV